VGESDDHNATDVQVRKQVCVPSIDCLVIKARLTYAGRLASNPRVSALKALFSAKPRGNPMPWAAQLTKDMQYMYDHTDIGDLVTPPGHGDAGITWIHAMQHEKLEFSRCVNQIFFSHSVLDSCPDKASAAAFDQRFQCSQCVPPVAFSTGKALQSHMRTKHRVRSSISMYIDDSGLCPICSTNFRSRIRVISHLSDVRRPKCRDCILTGCVPVIADSLYVQLQERDKQLRRKALHQGHTHPIASGSARTADGRTVGHVRH